MKNISVLHKALLVILFGAIFTLTSCEKDDDTPDLSGDLESAFIYDGESYSTSKAMVFIDGVFGDSTTDYDIYIYSPNLVVENLDNDAEISGNGDFVMLSISVDTFYYTLPEGEFPYEQDKGNTFYAAEVLINMDYDSEEENEIFLVERAGSVSITKTDNVYQIKYTLQLTNGKELTGTYNGVPEHAKE